MLPIYIVYFTGADPNKDTKKTMINAIGFVLGFTFIFVILGAFAATVGALLRQYQTIVNIVTGIIVIIFGLSFIGVFKFRLFNRTHNIKSNIKPLGFISTFLFGLIFAIGWTPCVGAFLGSALMLASQQGSIIKGILMLLVYSLGLGIPFIISAVLIDKLKNTFDLIKRHYRIINIICGLLLIIVGIFMMTGLMGTLLSLLTI